MWQCAQAAGVCGVPRASTQLPARSRRGGMLVRRAPELWAGGHKPMLLVWKTHKALHLTQHCHAQHWVIHNTALHTETPLSSCKIHASIKLCCDAFAWNAGPGDKVSSYPVEIQQLITAPCMDTESTVSGCPFGVEDKRNTRGSEKVLYRSLGQGARCDLLGGTHHSI